MVLAIGGMVLAVAATTSVAWIGREAARSAVYSIQTQLQLARMQAVSRNRVCQFTIDTATRQVQVVDLNDLSTSADDVVLSNVTVSARISFARPDGTTPVTLASVSGTRYQATFTQDGAVSQGAGVISVAGGDGFEQLTLYGAGGIRLERWNGSAWVNPS